MSKQIKAVPGHDPTVVNSIYTPAEVSEYTLEHIRGLQEKKDRAVKLGISGIGDYFADTMAGQVTAIIAQTSQYKSGFMHSWERALANQLMMQNRLKEIIVHVSVEECAEEQGLQMLAVESGEESLELARGNVQNWDLLNKAAIRIGVIPIYLIGDSLARAEDMPNLYLSNIARAIKFLRDEALAFQPKIAAIFVDYLQALPIDPETQKALIDQQRRLQVRSDFYRLRQMSAYFDCPVIVGVQAKQHLDGAAGEDMLIPGIYDGEESAAIAQRSDRIIQLWMPKMTHPLGSELEHKGYHFRVEENLLFVKVGKQRGGLPSGRVWKCRINFKNNTIAPEREFDEDGQVQPGIRRRGSN